MNTPHKPSAERYAVMLPCEPNQFNDFISSLLGKAQTINQQLEGSFDIELADLNTLYHLVNQRVAQQNRGRMIQFTCRINYNDGSSILLTSFEDLESHNEIRNVTATQVQMSWVFLLLFETKDVPEKQVVDVTFMRGGRWRDTQDIFSSSFAVSGTVAIQIQHTARTWGADLQGLLTNHLETIVTKESAWKTFVQKNVGKIMLLMTGMFFSLTFFGIYRASNALAQEQLKFIDGITGSTASVAAKVDGLLSLIHTNSANNFLLASLGYVMAASFLSFVACIWIGSSADGKKPSFITLSKSDEKLKAKQLTKNRNKWISFCVSILVSLATGILGNIIFTHYWS